MVSYKNLSDEDQHLCDNADQDFLFDQQREAENEKLREEKENAKIAHTLWMNAMELALASLRNTINFIKSRHGVVDILEDEVATIVQEIADRESKQND